MLSITNVLLPILEHMTINSEHGVIVTFCRSLKLNNLFL